MNINIIILLKRKICIWPGPQFPPSAIAPSLIGFNNLSFDLFAAIFNNRFRMRIIIRMVFSSRSGKRGLCNEHGFICSVPLLNLCRNCRISIGYWFSRRRVVSNFKNLFYLNSMDWLLIFDLSNACNPCKYTYNSLKSYYIICTTGFLNKCPL